MTLLEQLNYKCDALAKSAVAYGIITCTETVSTSRQRLPLESVALFHDGVKISGECGREIRFQIGKVEAREFTSHNFGLEIPQQRPSWQTRYVQDVAVQAVFVLLRFREEYG
jgi:hypothetical protein